MQSLAVVDLSTLKMTNQSHRTSGTTGVDIMTGDQTGFAYASMSRCSFTQREAKWADVVAESETAPSRPFRSPFAVQDRRGSARIELAAAGSDPLVSAAADIDYTGVFTATVEKSGAIGVSFAGFIDGFPAFECYANHKGVTKCLFTAAPPKGNTVMNLPFAANRPISGAVVFN